MGALKQTDKVINKGFGSFGRITERKVTKPRVKQRSETFRGKCAECGKKALLSRRALGGMLCEKCLKLVNQGYWSVNKKIYK